MKTTRISLSYDDFKNLIKGKIIKKENVEITCYYIYNSNLILCFQKKNVLLRSNKKKNESYYIRSRGFSGLEGINIHEDGYVN